MLIALMRYSGGGEVHVLADEDWDCLKLKMCKAWDVEFDFDSMNLWGKLRRENSAIFLDGRFFEVIDLERMNLRGGPETTTAFSRLAEILIDERTNDMDKERGLN